MTTVIFSGAPCAGKSTLARALSLTLMSHGHTVHHVDEVFKRVVETVRPIMVQHYLLAAKTQLNIQRDHGNAEFVVIDSPVFLYAIYAHNILRIDDDAEYAAYEKLRTLCRKETKTYSHPRCMVFHIQSPHRLDRTIVNYIDTFVSSHIRLTRPDLMPRLECILSYLGFTCWNRRTKLALEAACENAEASILYDHTSHTWKNDG